jgi:outer membrane protein assembly factor BamA
MNPKIRVFLLFVASTLFFCACSSVKHLPEGECMLVKNNVVVKDAKSPDFDNLRTYVRPVTNKKFMDLFRIKTVFYDWGQPTYNKKGKTKDSKFKRFLREKVGEAPVLLDSVEILNSLDQLKIVMKQLGYFDAEVDYRVTFKGKNYKKSKVDYFVTAGLPYTISHIDYDIPIYDYKRIVVLNKDGTLLSDGMQYNESLINQEFTRIINLIRDEGFYYVEKSIIRAEVSYDPPDSLGNEPRSVNMSIILNIPQNESATRYLCKYYFKDNYINPDAQPAGMENLTFDTVYYQRQNRFDSCGIYFIETSFDGVPSKRPFSYRMLSNAIHSRNGQTYSQAVRSRSSRTLTNLDIFDYISIIFREDESLLDTVNKKGYMDVIYRLTRKKPHSFGGQVELRNDKSNISLTYVNRNLFKGAEHLTVNLSGGYYYYSLNNLFKKNNTFSYPEFGVSATLDFPNRLFLFNRNVSENSISKSTSLNVAVNYSGLYQRLMYATSLTYRWNPSYYMSHSVSPIDVSTINNSDKRYTHLLNYDEYPESFQKKFGKFFLLSFKYTFNYVIPKLMDNKKHNMHLWVNFESCGLFLTGLNAIFTPAERWTLGMNKLDSVGYNYSTFEKLDVLWNYTYQINKDNALAMRADIGVIIPIGKGSYVPYEKGFYMGTSSSMRGWSYRGLGPGSYEHASDTLYTGDIKLELNLEYRGTLYRSFKYGIFADVGNIWLAQKNEDMPGADFSFKRFYKELAVDVGVGLRLDFDVLVIRVDWALPIYDPMRSDEQGKVINLKWLDPPHTYRPLYGLKVAIGYAF